jgi:hypothetical protein
MSLSKAIVALVALSNEQFNIAVETARELRGTKVGGVAPAREATAVSKPNGNGRKAKRKRRGLDELLKDPIWVADRLKAGKELRAGKAVGVASPEVMAHAEAINRGETTAAPSTEVAGPAAAPVSEPKGNGKGPKVAAKKKASGGAKKKGSPRASA